MYGIDGRSELAEETLDHLEGYRAYLTPTGQVYRSTTYWEFDPGTLLAMAGQIERDLAAGTATFREHWRPNAIAWYGFAQAGTASLRGGAARSEGHGAAGTARNERQGRSEQQLDGNV